MRNEPATSPLSSASESGRSASTLFMYALRFLFLLALCSVGLTLSVKPGPAWLGQYDDLVFFVFVGLGLMVIALDIWVPRKSLTAISGLFFGLVVGMVVAFGLSLIVDLVVLTVFPEALIREAGQPPSVAINAIKLAIGVICCYLSVSFILQTKDDVRFVIPYVEFKKETKGIRPLVLDTSVIVDGRIADIIDTRIMDSELVIPRFVLHELQAIADSGDKLKRARGKRGLDMLNKLQTSEKADITILDVVTRGTASVDEMLVDVAIELGGKVVTNDYNLNKIAQLRGVTVININDLANALKPVVLPGESLEIKVIKPGEEVGQGVGYLEDGTMVVAEGGRDRIGETVQITVTSVLQTSAGRMIFGRTDGAVMSDRRRPRTNRSQ